MTTFVNLLRDKLQGQQWISGVLDTGRGIAARARSFFSRISGRRIARIFRRIAFTYRFTSLIRRIVVINISGLLILAMGIMYLNQFRQGLIEAKVQSLVTQAKIVASALVASASVDPVDIMSDPESMLEMQSGGLGDYDMQELAFPIIPEKALPILNLLAIPIRAKVTIYDKDGGYLLSSSLRTSSRNKRVEPVQEPQAGFVERSWLSFKRRFLYASTPVYRDHGNVRGTVYEEVAKTIKNQKTSKQARINKRTELILSVSVPIKRHDNMLGVLFMVTHGGEIDAIVSAERFGIFRVLLFAAGVSVLLAILLAGQIAKPIRDLSAGATRVARSVKEREQLPDFSGRQDEIGDLSRALRSMTDSLYTRLESIGRFAADVAHELKNPLTSLRSAVETMPYMKTDGQREKLLKVILHDVRRMDRLITDISGASRMDAEMAFSDLTPIDLSVFLDELVENHNALHQDRKGMVTFNPPPFIPHNRQYYQTDGHKDRLGQVMINLVENAISFSPEDGKVVIRLKRVGDILELTVEDQGPGIPPDYLEKVFKRFYTDRPEAHDFGNNSGLGLNISEQIVEAHAGKIWAENILSGEKDEYGEDIRLGARFVIHLPGLKFRPGGTGRNRNGV